MKEPGLRAAIRRLWFRIHRHICLHHHDLDLSFHDEGSPIALCTGCWKEVPFP